MNEMVDHFLHRSDFQFKKVSSLKRRNSGISIGKDFIRIRKEKYCYVDLLPTESLGNLSEALKEKSNVLPLDEETFLKHVAEIKIGKDKKIAIAEVDAYFEESCIRSILKARCYFIPEKIHDKGESSIWSYLQDVADSYSIYNGKYDPKILLQ